MQHKSYKPALASTASLAAVKIKAKSCFHGKFYPCKLFEKRKYISVCIFRTLMHKTFTAKKLSPNGNVSAARESQHFHSLKCNLSLRRGNFFEMLIQLPIFKRPFECFKTNFSFFHYAHALPLMPCFGGCGCEDIY